MTFVGILNRECEKFKLNSLTEEQFNVWFLSELLSKLEHDKGITIQALTTEYNNLLNIKRDIMLVQKPSTSSLTSKWKETSMNLLVLWRLALRTF